MEKEDRPLENKTAILEFLDLKERAFDKLRKKHPRGPFVHAGRELTARTAALRDWYESIGKEQPTMAADVIRQVLGDASRQTEAYELRRNTEAIQENTATLKQLVELLMKTTGG